MATTTALPKSTSLVLEAIKRRLADVGIFNDITVAQAHEITERTLRPYAEFNPLRDAPMVVTNCHQYDNVDFEVHVIHDTAALAREVMGVVEGALKWRRGAASPLALVGGNLVNLRVGPSTSREDGKYYRAVETFFAVVARTTL